MSPPTIREPQDQHRKAERQNEIQPAEDQKRRQQLLLLDLRQRDQHRRVENAEAARRMADEPEQAGEDEGDNDPGTTPPALWTETSTNIASAASPRSSMPIPICSSVSRAFGSVSFQPSRPIDARRGKQPEQIGRDRGKHRERDALVDPGRKMVDRNGRIRIVGDTEPSVTALPSQNVRPVTKATLATSITPRPKTE